MLEPAFVGALRAEIEQDLGAEAAPFALVQIGLLHGLRDALRIAGEAFTRGRREPEDALLAPALALHFDSPPRLGATALSDSHKRSVMNGIAGCSILSDTSSTTANT